MCCVGKFACFTDLFIACKAFFLQTLSFKDYSQLAVYTDVTTQDMVILFSILARFQSTTKSHNVGANIQGALSLLKTHNPVLCSAATKTRRKYCRASSHRSDCDHAADVHEVLLGLQDEFGNMGL